MLHPTSEPSSAESPAERFVFPWAGVLANLPTTVEPHTSRRVGESGSRTREQLAAFHPSRVRPIWNAFGHSGSAVVEFRKNWTGFHDAMAFGRHFATAGRGRSDWAEGEGEKGSGLFGWVAGAEDWFMDGPVADHLRRNGDLKTVAELMVEESRRKGLLVANLENQIEEKDKHLQELEVRYNETSSLLEDKMAQRDRMHRAYNEEAEKLRRITGAHYRRIFEDNEKLRLELEQKQQHLVDLTKQSEVKRRALDDIKLKNTMSALHMATVEQKKADENVFKLVEEQKKEREFALKKLLQLEKQLDAKQKLELEIEQLRGKVQIMAHMSHGDSGFIDNMSKMNEELAEKLEEMEELENLNQTLVIKEKLSSDELQAARKEAIMCVAEMSKNCKSDDRIGVKKLGELDIKPFKRACTKRFAAKIRGAKAAEFHSKWQKEIENSGWNPYKVITVDGKEQEVVDEDDEKLDELKSNLGDEVHGAVCSALVEMRENNPIGRFVTTEIWNFADDRKATLIEAIGFMLKMWKPRR